MDLLRTKSVEQSMADTEDVGLPAQEEPLRPRPHGLRHRRDHRRRHLHADRQGGRGVRRPGRGVLVRDRGVLLRAGRALLRGVRLDRAGVGLGLHVLLRDARRAGRLDHRLGPDPRADAGRLGGRPGLEHLLRDVHGGDRARLAGRARPDDRHRLLAALQPGGLPARRGADAAGRRRHQGVPAGQPGAGRDQAVHRAVRDRRRHLADQGRQLRAVRAAGGRPGQRATG